jgi:rod shape-determining protein MreD
MNKSFFLKLFTIIFIIVLQFALLPRLGLHNYIDLLLPLLVFWILLEKYSFVYFMAFFGGIVFDLFSGLPLGTKTSIYILLVFLLIIIRKNFVRSFTPTTFVIITFVAVISYLVIEKLFLLTLGFGNYFNSFIFTEIIFEVLFIFILSFFVKKGLYGQSQR